ncbi:MAG: hypothetical protein CSA20_07790 [Deltaproteobacteria bacterium]|nr:MAG: hypothetical protein CSB23_04255 [Deltaproteobacteria bacterium]PIE72468.1 MAG: hypothetical protein CSA20_07790 [Deltaproteobacteria bacterium]
MYIPVLTTNPVGWAILGTAGYLAYKAGKKSGLKAEENLDKESMLDSSIKGAMKAAYKTKIKMEESLGKTKSKYSDMWNETKTGVESSAS